MSAFSVLLGLASALAAVLAAWPSNACLNGVVQERAARASMAQALVHSADELMARLLRGEEQLRLGNLAGAAAELEIVERRLSFAEPRVRSRFERSRALVSVRSEGRWPQAVLLAPNGPRYRAKALEDAAQVLRVRLRDIPNDPSRESELAEALAAIPKHREEARRMLDRLASEDLLTSAHAYGALARLHAAAHDVEGEAKAITVCRKLDPKGGACRYPGAPGA